MGQTSKRLIAEQVLFKLNGGTPDNSFPVQLPDVYKALEQKINTKFRVQQLNINLPAGETIPDNLCIATYENIPVTSFNQRSKATLPVMPVSLPRGMGIMLMYDPNYPERPFIPLQRGMYAMLQTDNLFNDLSGLVGYEPKGNEVILTKNLPLMGVTKITMELVVMDLSQYSETDALPIPASMEDELVADLIKDFIWVTPESGIVNNWTNANQKDQIKQ